MATQIQYCSYEQFKSLAVTQATLNRWDDVDAVNAELQAMSSKASTYIESQLDMPVDPNTYDMWLAKLVADMTAYEMFVKFGFNSNVMNADRSLRQRNDDAILWLEKYSRQEVHATWKGLGGTEDEEVGPFVYSSPGPGFGTGGCFQ